MSIERRIWAWWPVPVGAAVLAATAAVAVPALAGGAHGEQAKKPTLASLAKQITILRAQDPTLRKRISTLDARGSVAGVTGSAGPRGPGGDQGPPGAQGLQGAQGPAGPFPDGALPSGKTIRGTYAVQLPDGAITGSAYVPISFGFTLAAEPKPVVVAAAETPKPTGCPGTIYLPEADPGYLCIYRQFENGLGPPSVYRLGSVGSPDSEFADVGASGRIGASLILGVTGAGLHLGRGTRAVTSA